MGTLPKLSNVFTDKPDLPNKYSIEIGSKIRAARVEKGLSQEELAKAVYKRRASLSAMENGKMLPDIFTMMFFANRLQKSLDYFIPEIYRQALMYEEGELRAHEKELLSQFRRISVDDDENQKLAIIQIKALADFCNREPDAW